MNVVIALLSIVLRWLSRTEAQKAAEDAKMPQATIHIGPPKTASSAIEGVMKRPESYVSMSAQNTYWPDYKGRVIEQSKVVEFAYALFDGKDSDQFVDSIAQMGLFFNESLRMGHDVIMSCEQFLNIPPHMILQLKAMLRGFDVTVVAVYREYISHLVSWYKFSNRWMDGHTLRFSKYLLQGMDGMRDEGFLKLCEDWQVLGRLVIVDYYGSIAAGKSIPAVVLCEVGGVLCAETEDDSHANISDETQVQEVFTFFYQFIDLQQGWEVCKAGMDQHEQPTALVAFFQKAFRNRPPALRVPTLKSQLTALVEHSVALDGLLRQEMGAYILHGNASANKHYALNSIHVVEVDVEALFRDHKWVLWMRGVFDSAVQRRLLCTPEQQQGYNEEGGEGGFFWLMWVYVSSIVRFCINSFNFK